MHSNLSGVDLGDLHAFVEAAKAGSLRQAATVLNITEPPLSRKIKRLEENLGIQLFQRTNRGIELTGEGQKALALIEPLLLHASKTLEELGELASFCSKRIRLGLTTAFEQAIFARFLNKPDLTSVGIVAVRKSSPELLKDLAAAKLDAAFVALPIARQGLVIRDTGYSEQIMAAVPEKYAGRGARCSICEFAGLPLFWFRRSANAAFYDLMQARFNEAGYRPEYALEPPEHDVLLARIAAGEGMALMPASFAIIERQGVRFVALTEAWEMRLGVAWRSCARLPFQLAERF